MRVCRHVFYILISLFKCLSRIRRIWINSHSSQQWATETQDSLRFPNSGAWASNVSVEAEQDLTDASRNTVRWSQLHCWKYLLQEGKKKRSPCECSWNKKSRAHTSVWQPKLCVSLTPTNQGWSWLLVCFAVAGATWTCAKSNWVLTCSPGSDLCLGKT